MPNGMDERKKGLEEEYFHRKNKEAIEKLRAKMKVAEEAKAAGISTMKCPRCDGTLKETTFEEIAIDICDNCGGVWLDSGELEHLTRKPEAEAGGWFSRLWFAEG
jgi:Zn-finger nucleic acid-binding protein